MSTDTTVHAFLRFRYFTVQNISVSVEFLHTVTEDNAELHRPELLQCIQQLMSKSVVTSYDLLIRTLATGETFHVCQVQVLGFLRGLNQTATHAFIVKLVVQTH